MSRSNSISTGDVSSAVKFEGFLEKQGKLIGSFIGKKCWCVLTDSRLSYYKNASKLESCSGYIDVSRVQSVLKTSKVNSFNVLTTSGTHSFVAVSTEARDQWVKAIQDAMTVAGRRLDMQRHSIVSCVMYDENSEDDETGKVTMVDNVFEDDDKRSTLCAESKDNNASTTDEMGSCRDVDEAKFTYMNAADLAEALHGGRDDVMRVRSVHSESDQQDSDPHHSAENPASTDGHDNPSLSSASNKALPVEVLVHDSTSDVTPRASKIPVESSSDPKREPDASISNKERLDSVQRALSTSPNSSPRRPSDVREDGVGNGSCSGSVESSECEPMSADKPVSRVILRRPSRPMVTPSHAITPTAVIELHVDQDVKPTTSDDFQLDQLSTESGSAIEALRQFIENDRCFARSSTQTVPTAIQPGKAFDSLKYFVSTLD